MSRSALRETIALTKGEEIRNGQHTQIPVELEMEKRRKNKRGTLHVRAQYRASQDRIIEIPLDTEELRRLHHLTESILNE